ncbi:MAG: response regulator, partial [Proteobacteria bacterium]
LILTELQAGRLYPRNEPFSLQALLDSMQMQFSRQAHAKGLAFTVERAAGLPDRLQGDAKKLALCLACLIDNGIKFTREGSVNVRVSGGEPQDDHLQVIFKVSDSGIGFTHRDEETLYQRFYQLDGSMTREYGGLGIGLAICRQLAELVGGQLHHQSEPGRGSCFEFSVRLGVVEAHPGRALSTSAGAFGTQRAAHECTVLLVDDNSVDQLVVRGMLLKLGYRVRTAEDGSGALALLARERFDAVLMECRLPTQSALQTTRALRSLPGCERLPVLAITDVGQQGQRERCLEAGVSVCLARPVRFEELQTLLHGCVLAQPKPLSPLAADAPPGAAPA